MAFTASIARFNGTTAEIERSEEPCAIATIFTLARAKAEKKLEIKPELVRYLSDVSGYDDIFVCGPCWWSTFPMAVYAQLEKLDLKGKRIHPLMTHEGSGLGHSEEDLKKYCPGAEIEPGLAITGSHVGESLDSIRNWIASFKV